MHHGGNQFDFDGGHAMLFEKLEGMKMTYLHSDGERRQNIRCIYFRHIKKKAVIASQ